MQSRVPDAAPVAQQLRGPVRPVERSSAVGAGQTRGLPERLRARRASAEGDVDLLGEALAPTTDVVQRPGEEREQRPGQLGRGADHGARHLAQRRVRHRVEGRVGGLLHRGRAPVPDDLEEPRRPVVEHAAEHHPDRARAHIEGEGAEERVDRGTVPVLAGATGDAQRALLEQQVVSGHRDLHQARGRDVAVGRGPDGEVGPAVQQVRRPSRRTVGLVDHDEDGGRQRGREPGQHRTDRLQAAGRRADADHPRRVGLAGAHRSCRTEGKGLATGSSGRRTTGVGPGWSGSTQDGDITARGAPTHRETRLRRRPGPRPGGR